MDRNNNTKSQEKLEFFCQLEHTGSVYSVAISSDGKYALSGSEDRTIRLWDIETGNLIRTFEGHRRAVTSVAISPDNRYALSGSEDGTIRLWDINKGKEIAQFIGFEDGEWVVITTEGYFNAFSNEAKYLKVRIGNNVYTIDEYYNKFYNPDYVASVLQGKKIE
jgi:WD40 repeat protein